MRKYRGKRKDNGEWVHGYLIGTDVIVGDIVDWDDEYFCTEFWYKVEPETVGQYTELHDDSEDQAELFEGDKVQVEYKGETHICKIEFFAGSFAFVADSLPEGYLYMNELAEYDREYGWVEGTIKIGLDNPDLLEG